MSSKARRLPQATGSTAFPWIHQSQPSAPASALASVPADSEQDVEATLQAAHGPRLAALEREAFSKGYDQGERAGFDAGRQRSEAMLQRLTQTLEQLTSLRTEMIHATERQMVQLALAVARRIVHREVSLDADLLIAMARVALDRLGESAQVTVRLHPDQYQASGAARLATLGNTVKVIADPSIGVGGCVVDSDFGALDVSVDAQLQELARALLGDTETAGSRAR